MCEYLGYEVKKVKKNKNNEYKVRLKKGEYRFLNPVGFIKYRLLAQSSKTFDNF